MRHVPTLRRGSGQGSRISAPPGEPVARGPSGPVVLLDSVSPYGSRRVIVEYDGTTAAIPLLEASQQTYIAKPSVEFQNGTLADRPAKALPLLPVAET